MEIVIFSPCVIVLLVYYLNIVVCVGHRLPLLVLDFINKQSEPYLDYPSRVFSFSLRSHKSGHIT